MKLGNYAGMSLISTCRTKLLWKLRISAVLINLAAILEKADENLLPAVYREVGLELGISPSQLGYLTFVRAFAQAISSPLAGILALRYPRSSVVGIGTLFWALSTAGVGISQNLSECAVWRAVNGVGLAIVIPSLQSYIADSHSENGRGAAFGWLSFVGSIGGMGGAMLATIMAGHTYGGYAGWRVAHILVAIFSSFIGLLVHFYVINPKEVLTPASIGFRLHECKEVSSQSHFLFWGLWRDSWSAIGTVLRVNSFQIIVLQGLVGSIPWVSMVFFTMWFELIGFGHKGAATLMGIFAAGCACGAFLGGWIADKASKRYPFTGRVMVAQFSSFMGVPFSLSLLMALPQDPQKWVLYAVTLACMGLCISWCQACANNPIFADVVKVSHRTMIYAFDRAFEGSFAALALAAPMVGILAESVFGYRVGEVISESGSSVEALALSRGLFTMMALPFALCCLFYTPLYFTYKRDYDALNHMVHPDEDLVFKHAIE